MRKKIIRIELAKNGEPNLIVDDERYYSKYNPKKDIEKFIASKINHTCTRYVLVGVGLGFHIDELLKQDEKEIIVVETEIDIFRFVKNRGYLEKYIDNSLVKFVHSFSKIELSVEDNLIILPAWKRHLHNSKLKLVIEQLEFEFAKGSNSAEMYKNFSLNIQREWNNITPLVNSLSSKTALLVSAGPDLDNQIEFLKRAKQKAYILCVSAAYKTLAIHNIKPDGIIAIDQKVPYSKQLNDEIAGIPLFLLSTVHPSFFLSNNKKYLLCQAGLAFVEEFASNQNSLLIESHGSVATAGLSLLQYFGAKQIVFVGQDLAMHENKSHSVYSTSNYVVPLASRYKTRGNSGEDVETQLQWLIFKRHLEKMIKNTPSITYLNTSYEGAKIQGAEYKNSAEILFE